MNILETLEQRHLDHIREIGESAVRHKIASVSGFIHPRRIHGRYALVRYEWADNWNGPQAMRYLIRVEFDGRVRRWDVRFDGDKMNAIFAGESAL